MPKITQLKQQVKNAERVSVFVDGKYAFSLTLDQLLGEKLKKDQDIEGSEIKRLKKVSEEGKLKARAVEWLLNRPHSVREFRDYGFRKRIEKDLLESWVEEFTQKKYLDDQVFAQWFADNRIRKNKSRRAIIAELLGKGISRPTAENVTSTLQDDQESLTNLIEKLKHRSRYKDEDKLKSYLLGKGFRYDDIKKALDS